jgi:hypothetical protein
LLLDNDINRDTDQQGRGEVEDLVEDGIEGGHDHGTTMKSGAAPEAVEGGGI